MKAFRKYGIFLIIPGIVLGCSLLLKLSAGPYWLAPNFDPAYQYLVNGLYLIKGIVPNHTDHPGTPLQMLFCAVCWLFNMGRSAPDIVIKVLISPELYLHTVFIILTLFSFFTSWGLAVYVFRKTGDRVAAGLTQLPALSFLVLKSWGTFETVFPVVANVDPEPLLISIVNIFNICLFSYFFAKTTKEKHMSTLFWGFVGGLGVATKITFFPVLIVPLIILSWKDKMIFICVFAASFVLWTFPIISRYPYLWAWFNGILTHTGIYGTGKRGVIEISSYVVNWKNIIVGQGIFAGLLLVALVFIFWKFISKKWDRGTSYLAATTLGVFFQFAVVAKHPGAHYLLPGQALFGALLALLYWQSVAHHVGGKRMALVFILVVTFLGVWQAIGYCVKLEGLTKDILAFHDDVSAKYPNCASINYYRSSDPQAALFFGDGWNLSPHLGKELSGLYPNTYYFYVWENSIFNFNGRVWANDLLSQTPCVLFHGDGSFDFSHGPYDVQLLQKGRFESTYLLTGTTEKQAGMFFAWAVHFFQTGEYEKALVCALQARKFHYQPDSSVESMLKLFKPNPQR